MRVAQQLLCSAAAAGMVSLAAACVIPPPGVGPRPEEEQLPAPDVAFYNFDEAPYGAGSGIIAYSVTREAYAAAFEVDQRGRVRVLAPSTPRDMMRTTAGKNYVLFPQLRAPDREFLSASTDFSRVPFVFVLTSDTPLDLSAFGTGRTWSHDIVVGARDPDSTIADVARRVLADAPAYGSDYTYVGPLLRGGERQFVAQCARPLEDVHDYGYYRDLWAVFTPADQRLSVNTNWLFSPALGWSSYSLLPLAAYRAQFATDAFYAGCASAPSPYVGRSYWAYSGSTGSGVLGGFGPYGYGYVYPYGPGVVAVAPIPVTRLVPPLRVPRIPVGLGMVQVAGAVPASGPATNWVRPDGQAPTHFSWRAFGNRGGPGEVQPNEVRPTTRSALGENRPGFLHPIERRGFERHPMSDGTTQVTGVRPFAEPRQSPGAAAGQAITRAAQTFSPPAASPMNASPTNAPAVSSRAENAIQARSEAKSSPQ